MRYQNGTYTVSTKEELDSRAKIYQNVLKAEDWVIDKVKSKGNATRAKNSRKKGVSRR